MKIYGAALSPFVRKLMIYCAEAQLAYEQTPTFPAGPDGQNPEFLAVSPLGKIPAINDDGFCLADSSAILHYLDAKYAKGLIPSDPQARGQAVFFDEIADTVLGPIAGALFFNRVVAPKFMGREGDLAAADLAEKETLPALLTKLEKMIPVSGGFLVGGAFSIADISLASAFVNVKHGGVVVDAADFPRLAAWLASIWARPSFAAQLAMEAKIMQ